MDRQYFEVTADHIKLLRAAYVDWCDDEFGAPSINPKRPYGNGSVYADMVRILEWGGEGEHGAFTEAQEQKLRALHEETRTVLQIMLRSAWFRPGRYVADKYSVNWQPVEDPPAPTEDEDQDEDDSDPTGWADIQQLRAGR